MVKAKAGNLWPQIRSELAIMLSKIQSQMLIIYLGTSNCTRGGGGFVKSSLICKVKLILAQQLLKTNLVWKAACFFWMLAYDH